MPARPACQLSARGKIAGKVDDWSAMAADTSEIARRLAEAGRRFDARGWVLGTSGNFSAVITRDPLRLAITASGAWKGNLTAAEILEMDADLSAVAHRAKVEGSAAQAASPRPSAEARLHLEIVRERGAGAVLHTHSLWSTLLSDRHAAAGGLAIEGYEMLKGLERVT